MDKFLTWRLGLFLFGSVACSTQSRSVAPDDSGENTEVDAGGFEPSEDPGADPVFEGDPELAKTENYSYEYTEPGDHDFPVGTCTLQFDAVGVVSLFEALQSMKSALGTCTGLALYLTSTASMLRDEDLRTLQILNRSEAEGGVDASKLLSLYVYNLKTLQGGVECTPDSGAIWPNTGEICAGETAIGNPGPYLWANGWASSWVQNLVMDDLEEVRPGTFCNAKFYSVGLRGARVIGKMAFGEQPHGHLKLVYLPSAITIGEHAFRRIQVGLDSATKINLPRVTRIDSYAFDDNTDLTYVNAPALQTMGRNVFNDSGRLIAVNMPKLTRMEHGCFGINQTMRVMRLPALETIIGDALSNLQELRFLYVPALRSMGDGALNFDAKLAQVFAPNLTFVSTGAMRGTLALKELTLPADGLVLNNGAFRDASIETLSIRGRDKTLEGMPFETCTSLTTIYFGDTPPVQKTENAFAQTSSDLVCYYSGPASTWADFKFNGNESAKLVAE